MSEQEYREFWILKEQIVFGSEFSSNPKDHACNAVIFRIPIQTDSAHFIEYSAYKAEREKVRKLVDSLRKLNNEVAAMVATHGDIIAQDYGRTNLECLEFRLNGSRALLKEIEDL